MLPDIEIVGLVSPTYLATPKAAAEKGAFHRLWELVLAAGRRGEKPAFFWQAVCSKMWNVCRSVSSRNRRSRE
jgi:hypothetical protein